MEGGVVCPRCRTEIADNKALMCPSCELPLRMPNSAKLGLTAMGFGTLLLLLWGITVRSVFDVLAFLVGLFYNPIDNRPIRPGPAPDLRNLLGEPVGRWVGDVVDWLGLNPALPPNDTLLWIGAAALFLGLAIASYGAAVVRLRSGRAAAG